MCGGRGAGDDDASDSSGGSGGGGSDEYDSSWVDANGGQGEGESCLSVRGHLSLSLWRSLRVFVCVCVVGVDPSRAVFVPKFVAVIVASMTKLGVWKGEGEGHIVTWMDGWMDGSTGLKFPEYSPRVVLCFSKVMREEGTLSLSPALSVCVCVCVCADVAPLRPSRMAYGQGQDPRLTPGTHTHHLCVSLSTRVCLCVCERSCSTARPLRAASSRPPTPTHSQQSRPHSQCLYRRHVMHCPMCVSPG